MWFLTPSWNIRRLTRMRPGWVWWPTVIMSAGATSGFRVNPIEWVTLDEVIDAVRKLKKGKSPGADNIPAEFVTNAGDISRKLLWKICTEVWNKGKWPKIWTNSLIVTIPKNGNLKKCNNYRTISLISHPSKVLLQIVLSRLKAQAESIMAEEQAGFRAGRSTTEQILNLRILNEQCIAHNR